MIGSALLVSIFEWLEITNVAKEIRQSNWLYPFIEIIHIFGIVLVAGGAVMFDIQLISRSTVISSSGTSSLLLWSKRGLILAVPSGILLFITNAVSLAANPFMTAKMLLLFVAGLNAYVFHLRAGYLRTNRESTTTAKFHAVLSMLLWMAIIACGRLLAY